MNSKEKSRIIELRQEGLGYKRIAGELNISVNTIKSFCRSHHLTSKYFPKPIKCKTCRKEIQQNCKRKARVFCCETCKQKWWNEHRTSYKNTQLIDTICLSCGKPFKSYSKTQRKFCCHGCYVHYRFKGGDEIG